MKKGFKTAALAAAMLMLFAACGGTRQSASGSSSLKTDSGRTSYGYYDVSEGITAYESANFAPEQSVKTATQNDKDGSLSTASSQLWENTKIVYRATVNLQSTEFDETCQLLLQMTASAGGYVEKQYVNNGSAYSSKTVSLRSASFTIRVPSEKFSSFLDGVSENCHVVYINQSSEDIGEQYFNTEQRLQTLNNKHDRLEELLAKADKMSDIITIEDALSDTEYEINRLTATLNKYDSLVGFSTINIELAEVARTDISVTEDPGFFERLGRSFKDGMADFGEFLDDLAMWASYNIMGIIIFVVIVVVLVKVKPFAKLRKRAGTRSERKAAKAAEKNAEQQ